MELKSRTADIFKERFGRPPLHVARAPGRVNLLGEHVDYNDGFVMPAAIDQATYVAYGPSGTRQTTVTAVDFNEETASFDLERIAAGPTAGGSLAAWARYPAGVAWALSEKGLAVEGMNAVLASDVPRGAGLSSSASVELAFGVAWAALAGWSIPPMEMALLCQHAENDYVGVKCGIMDQFACACGEPDRLLVLDCRSLEYRSLPLPEGVAVVVADTSVRRTLADSAYNNRRAACEEAVRILKRDLPDITALRDVSPSDFARFSAKLPPEVQRRARHVVEEIERTRQAVKFLETGDMAGFGERMNKCHASLRDLYEVSCAELDAMVRVAQSLEGCYGARLTGAGFGGCTVNLVDRQRARDFSLALAAGYESATGRQASIYLCRASAGAGLI